MNKIKIIIILFNLFTGFSLAAQPELGYGFRAGLSFSNVDGPSASDANGNELETRSISSGFTVGALINLGFNDHLGIRTEVLYAQKGTVYDFEGPSYFIFDPKDTRTAVLGIRNVSQEISNSYIEIPLLTYVKFGPIELQAGAYAGFLVASTAVGKLTFKPNGNAALPIEFDLDYRFISDAPNDFSGEVGLVTFENKRLPLPSTLGAYYEFAEGKDNFYKTFDAGLVGALSFYLNRGLFVNLRAEYGLTDVSNPKRDVSLIALDNKQFIETDDLDKNISFQASIGFKF
jgi:hypothetical protein